LLLSTQIIQGQLAGYSYGVPPPDQQLRPQRPGNNNNNNQGSGGASGGFGSGSGGFSGNNGGGGRGNNNGGGLGGGLGGSAIGGSGSGGGGSGPGAVQMDPIDMLRMAVPGEPGIDYPIYNVAPNTGFSCDGRVKGLYSDPGAECQAWHFCLDDRSWTFLCPNGTIFNQELFTCVWWFNFDCSTAESLYELNEELYIIPEDAGSLAGAGFGRGQNQGGGQGGNQGRGQGGNRGKGNNQFGGQGGNSLGGQNNNQFGGQGGNQFGGSLDDGLSSGGNNGQGSFTGDSEAPNSLYGAPPQSQRLVRKRGKNGRRGSG